MVKIKKTVTPGIHPVVFMEYVLNGEGGDRPSRLNAPYACFNKTKGRILFGYVPSSLNTYDILFMTNSLGDRLLMFVILHQKPLKRKKAFNENAESFVTVGGGPSRGRTLDILINSQFLQPSHIFTQHHKTTEII
ncbi:hypothetical protein [uncultured Desulfobacter sp.]|uniref:hypothetical protein n=1 Tax=uncultured Desulfobacter sp. TaxID=240139 RepID=UPI0029C65080|nr:hypothetical protein [uncultured Desulfobacter sp.]